MLFIFGGLPGTGKSELAIDLARKFAAAYLRIDTIEQAMRDGGMTLNGPEGYIVAYHVAEDNLRLGRHVVADAVNPITITRKAWREVAARAGVDYCEIEIICSNTAEHRLRVERRQSQIPGLRLPTWEEVTAREYDNWESQHIVIDTAGQTPDGSKEALEQALHVLKIKVSSERLVG